MPVVPVMSVGWSGMPKVRQLLEPGIWLAILRLINRNLMPLCGRTTHVACVVVGTVAPTGGIGS